MTLVNNVLNRHVRTSGLHKNMKTWADNKDRNRMVLHCCSGKLPIPMIMNALPVATYETWTYIGRNPDWVQLLNREWSDANSAWKYKLIIKD